MFKFNQLTSFGRMGLGLRTAFQPARLFSQSFVACKVNKSERNKYNVHDLETFLTLIGRNLIEYLDVFNGDLQKFIDTKSREMRALGVPISARRYLIRWKLKFITNSEPLREHQKGYKKNGGERKAKTVIAKKKALKKLEEKERFANEELEAEQKGERQF